MCCVWEGYQLGSLGPGFLSSGGLCLDRGWMGTPRSPENAAFEVCWLCLPGSQMCLLPGVGARQGSRWATSGHAQPRRPPLSASAHCLLSGCSPQGQWPFWGACGISLAPTQVGTVPGLQQECGWARAKGCMPEASLG